MRVDVERTWFELRKRRAFSSLAVIPSLGDQSALHVAHDFAELALRVPRARPLVVAVETTAQALRERLCSSSIEQRRVLLPPTGSVPWLDAGWLKEMRAGRDERDLLFVVVPSPLDHPSVVPLVRLLDASVVCVWLGKTSLASMKALVAQIGYDHFAGAVAVEAPPSPQKAVVATLRDGFEFVRGLVSRPSAT